MKNWIIGALATALAVSVAAGVIAQPGGRTATVEVRVWEDVNDPERNYVSARPEGGSWRTLGTIPIPLTDGVSSSGRFRYGDITLAVPLPDAPTSTPDPCDTSRAPWSSFRSSVRMAEQEDARQPDGSYLGAYTGTRLPTKDGLQIDHIVARKYACENGGASWSDETVRAFVNDRENLIGVTASENSRKSDKGPADYLPAQWRCEYAAAWRTLVARYDLSLPARDDQALAMTEAACSAPTASPVPTNTPTLTPTPIPGPRFSTCSKARAAGYANLTAEDVTRMGIRTRDSDGDGLYCES